MSNRPAVYVLGGTVFEVWPDSVRTILPDGYTVPAAPEDTPEYRATAERLGYGTDTLAMSRDHEALHNWLCHALGLQYSPTMARVAHGLGGSDLTALEEDIVLAIQRFARAAGVDVMAAVKCCVRRNGGV